LASADIEVRVQNALGASSRAPVEKRNKKGTYLCQRIRGSFTKDRKIAKPLTGLLAFNPPCSATMMPIA